MKSKLSKAEQTLRTRRAIIDRARQLFATQGYAATGTEEIISELGITRGALYHQFQGKQGVFKAVIAEAFEEITAYAIAKIEPLTDSWDKLIVGCDAFLEILQREDLRRLVFIEAPAVLEAEVLAEFDQYGFGLLQQGIMTVAEEGKLDTIDAEGFAYLVNGALNELAGWIAKSDSSKRLKIAQDLVKTLLLKYKTSE